MQLHRPRRHHTGLQLFSIRFSPRQLGCDPWGPAWSRPVRAPAKPSSYKFAVDLRLSRTSEERRYAWPGRNVLVLGMQPLISMADRKSTRLNSSHLGISYAV